MTKKWIIQLATLAGVTAFGATGHGASLFPVSAPTCNIAVVPPTTGSGYYLNDNCTAAFVLPSNTGTVRVEAVHEVSNLDMCPGLRRARLRVADYETHIDGLVKRLATENLSEDRQNSIRENIAIIRELLAKVYDNYKNVPAATIQLSFTRPSMQSVIGEYLMLNPNLGADYRLRFQPAPISDGVIIFSALDSENIALSPVIRASIPGMRPTADPSKFEGTAVFANGEMSGQLVMSLAGLCPSTSATNAAEVIKGNQVVTPQIRQNLVANMVANFTYTVPVLESTSYTAELDSDTALRNFVSKSENRTQFTVRQSAELFSEGSAGTAFRFTITDYGFRSNDETRAAFGGTLRQEVQERLSAALIQQMAMAGFLDMSSPAPDANAPEPGTVDVVHTRRECRHNSGFLGIGGSSRCYDVPYIIKVPQGSSATLFLSKVNNTTFRNVEEAAVNTVNHRKHSGTYKPALN